MPEAVATVPSALIAQPQENGISSKTSIEGCPSVEIAAYGCPKGQSSVVTTTRPSALTPDGIAAHPHQSSSPRSLNSDSSPVIRRRNPTETNSLLRQPTIVVPSALTAVASEGTSPMASIDRIPEAAPHRNARGSEDSLQQRPTTTDPSSLTDSASDQTSPGSTPRSVMHWQ
jgi:hypothetical protein